MERAVSFADSKCFFLDSDHCEAGTENYFQQNCWLHKYSPFTFVPDPESSL